MQHDKHAPVPNVQHQWCAGVDPKLWPAVLNVAHRAPLSFVTSTAYVQTSAAHRALLRLALPPDAGPEQQAG